MIAYFAGIIYFIVGVLLVSWGVVALDLPLWTSLIGGTLVGATLLPVMIFFDDKF